MAQLTAETIDRARRWMMLGTGLCCLAYALMALAQGRPDPFLWYVPGALGALSGMVIGLCAALAGKAETGIAMDELNQMIAHRAQAHSYWGALLLYPGFGVALWQGWVTYPVAFAAMGTLTGAAYLLLFFIYEARMQ